MNFAEIMEMLRNPQAVQARISELKEKTEQLERANREILTIAEIGRRITASLELHKVVGILHESLAPLLSTEVLGIAVSESLLDLIPFGVLVCAQDGSIRTASVDAGSVASPRACRTT